MIKFDARIFGGLPVIVHGRICGPEPDVGIRRKHFEVEDVTFPSGYPISDKMWQRLQRSPDWERLHDEGLEASAPDPDALRDLKREAHYG